MIPKCPRHLKGEARAYWREVVPLLIERGYGDPIFRPAMTLMCLYYGRHMELLQSLPDDGEGKVCSQQQTLMGICFDKWERLQAQFGMTPKSQGLLKPTARTTGGVGARKREEG